MPTAMTFNERFSDNEQRIAANREDLDSLLDRIEWEPQDSVWRMHEPTSPDLYDKDYIDGLQETLTNAIEAIDHRKLEKNLGPENAGTYLAVDSAGMITPEQPLITGINNTYLEIVNSILGLNSLIPDRLDALDSAVAAVNIEVTGKLDNRVDTGLAGQVITVSETGALLPRVSRPLWNNIQQKPFATLKPEDFIVQNNEASVTDRWTQGIQELQANLDAETARIDGLNEIQDTQIQNLQNSKLAIPFNITDGNIPVFSNTPAPAVVDRGVKPTDFVHWTHIHRVPVLWV